MIKNIFIAILVLLCSINVMAQELTVKSFEQTTDAIARTRNVKGTDGNVCAAVVVRIPSESATFNGGFILNKPTYKNGEYILDMQTGAAQMRVSVPGFNTIDVKFRDYIGSTLQSKTTYLLTINMPQTDKSVQQDNGLTYFILNVKPKNALVTIDGNTLSINYNGEYSTILPRTTHTYMVEADGYVTERESFILGSEKKELNVSLKSTVVEEKPQTTNTENGRGYVDLGLSSGTLWATCNLGATEPDGYGEYYAWGETTAKSQYSDSNYTYPNNPATLPLDHDAANVLWGGNWRMPTTKEFKELKNKCTWTWTSLNGTKGYKVKSKKNGNFIFLPAANRRGGQSTVGYYGYYWSSSASSSDKSYATGLGCGSGGIYPENEQRRYFGQSIRPVCSTLQKENTKSGALNTSEVAGSMDKIQTFTVNGVSFNMIPVEGGTFTMGATKESLKASYSKNTPHRVTLSSYFIGETEVTQALWKAVMGSDKNYWDEYGEQKPVVRVTWNNCQQFIEKLDSITGKNFRLPTEAEWEYAARGGKKNSETQYSGSNNCNSVAWWYKNSKFKIQPVKMKKPNELGIYDMSGNAEEWCQDYWSDKYESTPQTNPTGPKDGNARVQRGGSIRSTEHQCIVTEREYSFPTGAGDATGFRLVLSE